MSQTESKKALLLIGYQNDYFAADGVLQAVVEESVKANNVLENTLKMIDKALEQNVSVYATPIKFNDRCELLRVFDPSNFSRGSERK